MPAPTSVDGHDGGIPPIGTLLGSRVPGELTVRFNLRYSTASNQGAGILDRHHPLRL